MRGFFFLFQQGIGGIKRETACPGGVEEALQWRSRQSVSGRESQREAGREKEGGGARIAFLLHQFRVTRFEDAGSDILIGFALTSLPTHTPEHTHTHTPIIESSAQQHGLLATHIQPLLLPSRASVLEKNRSDRLTQTAQQGETLNNRRPKSQIKRMTLSGGEWRHRPRK